ncbi:hypothetical protein PV326_000438, partial [Microctonus aethiopoides]
MLDPLYPSGHPAVETFEAARFREVENSTRDEGMHDIVQESERLWKQLTEGGMVMEQPRRLHRNSREERIRDYQRSLETGRFTMGEFLSQIFAPKVMNLKKYLPDEREGPVEWMEENEQADLQDSAVLFA